MSDLAPTDHDLAIRIRSGDSRAFDALVVRYYQPLVNMVLRYVHSPDVAEDVLQDVFIRLWERRASWEIPGSVRAYLYTAARNAAFDVLRRAQTRARLEHAGTQDGAREVTETPVDQLEREEFAQALQRAIGDLSERGREIYILSYQHGLSYREIAEMLGISIPTVKTHMARAIVTLEKKLCRFLSLMSLL